MRDRTKSATTDLFNQARANDPQRDWETTSSPKPGPSDRALFGPFASVYASFSRSFAIEALSILTKSKTEVVLDPFSGVGTSLAAANHLGLPSIGFDLSPFSIALTKLSFSKPPEASVLDQFLDQAETEPRINPLSPETRSLFTKEDLALIAALVPSNQANQTTYLREILESCSMKLTDIAYTLLCSIVAANKAARVATGSNPVWMRKLIQDEPIPETKLKTLSRVFAEKLRSQCILQDNPIPRVRLADARSMPIEAGSVDVVLFSPPYLNRLDYFVKDYPANKLLCDLAGLDSRTLRKDMIGTTLISQKDASPFPIGNYCKVLLNDVWRHSSKASRSYYYWNYADYITATYAVATEIQRVMKPGGRGAIVVQDSFYKDLRVLTHEIIIEALAAQGLSCRVSRREAVKGHMGQMSPSQRTHARTKTLYEYVLTFEYV